MKTIKEKIKKIKVLAMDVDGVLTNGKINLDHQGREIKVFDVQDGFAIAIFRHAGYRTAIISARSAGAVTARAKDLKITKVYQDAYPKIKAYEKLKKDLNVKDEEICFMGDDLPDLCLLRRVGLPVAVSNAAQELKTQAAYVTKSKGGSGAVREVIEMILKTKGQWKAILKQFK